MAKQYINCCDCDIELDVDEPPGTIVMCESCMIEREKDALVISELLEQNSGLIVLYSVVK